MGVNQNVNQTTGNMLLQSAVVLAYIEGEYKFFRLIILTVELLVFIRGLYEMQNTVSVLPKEYEQTI